MKPLVARWRKLGCKIVVFYDDGMVVANSEQILNNRHYRYSVIYLEQV
jgi:hypothetical protein